MELTTIDLARAQAIPGWMADEELAWLARQAQAAKVVVEIGCWQGRSTRALADHCPGVVCAIDPWAGPYYTERGRLHSIKTDVYQHFERNLRDHLDSGRVVPMQTPSVDGLRALESIGVMADLVFIDGDHREEACRADIDGALKILGPGGVLSGHDYGHGSWPGVRRAVDALFGDRVQRCRLIWWIEV